MLLPRVTILKNLTPDNAVLHGLRLGHGPIPLLLIPGAGDGKATARHARLPLALYLRPRLNTFTITYLSRRDPLPAHWRMEDHARDYLHALDQLGWMGGIVECNSGGGPIGQQLAALRPDLVRGLVLSVTMHRTAPETRAVLTRWLTQLDRREWRDFNWDSIEKTFRPATVAKYRPLRPLLGFSRLRDPMRLRRVLEGLLDIDQRDVLPRITCETLVIGGADDQVIPAYIQREMAGLIPHATLKLYGGYGHGNDQENPDYLRQLTAFSRDVMNSGAGRTANATTVRETS
ncbi:alpha/beta fold hydrolase [Deinococcus apachensis]|uniref:alpha/beta fold hydrolase n=1 Tax=Deinococcus apachensis TaxID=309886 RepID=UPI00037EE727|nr:alpha/beta hydrolase [Deinococcus apachensis]